jgi:hypothetical protein
MEEGTRKREQCSCYCLTFVLFCGLFTGVYFIIQSYKDPQTTEISLFDPVLQAWSSEYAFFSSISVQVSTSDNSSFILSQNLSDSWSVDIENFPDYLHLFYSNNSILINSPDPKLVYENAKEYNVTTNVTISVLVNNTEIISEIEDVVVHSRTRYPVNAKVCRNAAKGFWDVKSEACYYHLNTDVICLVLNESLQVVDWYRNGCDNQGFIKQEAIVWTTDKEFTDYSFKTRVEIRSERDPYVFAAYNQMVRFSPSSKEYWIIGITLTTIFSVLLLVPIGYVCCCRKKRQAPYLTFESNPQKVF